MTLGRLRSLMVTALLGLTSGTILFFLIAPAIHYPLEFEQGWALAQISVPVFAGYLGTATQFATMSEVDDAAPAPPLLSRLVFGPLIIYVVGAVALLLAFWMTNRPGAPLGQGMTSQMLSTILTSLLGIVTVTSNIAIAKMFKKER